MLNTIACPSYLARSAQASARTPPTKAGTAGNGLATMVPPRASAEAPAEAAGCGGRLAARVMAGDQVREWLMQDGKRAEDWACNVRLKQR